MKRAHNDKPIAAASVLLSTQSNSDAESQRILLEPFLYLTQARGKEIRSKLVNAFDAWLQVPADKLKVISEIIEMLHTASLLFVFLFLWIDDVEDGSDLRRGIPVAHKIFGVASAINSGNYVYFLALQKAISLQLPQVIDVFAQELINLHTGQGMEIYWRDNNICPTEKEYLQMISNKTGGLLRLAIKMMQAASQNPIDCVKLVDMLGLHFQIRDDYLNLTSNEFTNNKGFAEDLTEGKFSYPVIRHIQSTHAAARAHEPYKQTQLTSSQVTDPGSRQLFQILKQRSTDVDLKKYAIQTMKPTLHAMKHELRKLEDDARSEIHRLGGNAALEKILAYLGEAYSESASMIC
ncbi:Geranylgeranyl pyrophosphate synthase [Chytriomyces hyalinus]|nr:Geranylgeranyl pyrophosphate synthase [Chytriomyces hyalinus]